MKGDPSIVSFLNRALAEELTAINQYMVHSEMCSNWGYEKLHQKVERRAIQEMKHAESLIARILFLEGIPEVSKLSQMHIGADVKKQILNDTKAEEEAVNMYNEGIALCAEKRDAGTRELLQNLVKEEEEHLDWLETQTEQISQMGIELYLLGQKEKD